jgi:hypothetical protein
MKSVIKDEVIPVQSLDSDPTFFIDLYNGPNRTRK